jgi:peptide/nickel transport system substrate-binding protein
VTTFSPRRSGTKPKEETGMTRRLLAAIAVVAVVAAACGGTAQPSASTGTPSNPPASTATNPPPAGGSDDLFGTAYDPSDGPDGGQAIFADWQEANLFNPFYVSQQTEANVAAATWATLIVLTYDYKYAPDLAKDIPTTDNGGVKVPGDGDDAMTVTWTLRDGLKWSDGEALTCDDFKYAWEWVLDPDNAGAVTSGYEDIDEFECVDDVTMVLHYKNVYEGYITTQVAPLPRHHLEDIPIADQVNGAGMRAEEIADLPVSGAFKFESVTPGSELRVIRNPNYTSFATGKPAHLDTLIFKWYTDADAMIAGYKNGEVDVATDLQDSDLPKVTDLGSEVSAIQALTYEFLRPNWADGSNVTEDGVGDCSRNPALQDRGDGCPMADPAMREAIAYAVDKNAVNTRLLGGTVKVANAGVTPDAWFYAEQPPATFDPEHARQILEDAGWVDSDGDGVREKNGLKAKIELCTTTRQVRIDTLTLLAGWLADVGIESVVNPVDSTAIFAAYNEATLDTPCAVRRSNFDLALHAFTSSIDPLGNYFSYHSSQFEPTGANDANVSDPELDAALDAVKASVEFDVIREATAEFQRIYVERTVEIPLYYRQNVDLHVPAIRNFSANPTQAGPLWNVVDWYIQE